MPVNERGNILHDQAKYWGKHGVHYHQFFTPARNAEWAVLEGSGLREAILEHGSDWLSKRKSEQWFREPDEVVIGHRVPGLSGFQRDSSDGLHDATALLENVSAFKRSDLTQL